MTVVCVGFMYLWVRNSHHMQCPTLRNAMSYPVHSDILIRVRRLCVGVLLSPFELETEPAVWDKVVIKREISILFLSLLS